MNKIFTMSIAFATFMLLTASTLTAEIRIPEKYSLNNQLEQVHKFWRTNLIDWEDVDNQSLVVETSPGHYYLLVLTVPSYELPFQWNRIGITSSGSMIREGIDSVIVPSGAHFRSTYPIERIYKIDGRQQMRAIIDQLQGKKAKTHID